MVRGYIPARTISCRSPRASPLRQEGDQPEEVLLVIMRESRAYRSLQETCSNGKEYVTPALGKLERIFHFLRLSLCPTLKMRDQIR